MDKNETDWRTILLLIGAAGGAVIAFAAAAVMLLYAGLSGMRPSDSLTGRSAFDFFVLAGAPLAIGAAFLPSIYFSVRRLSGRTVGTSSPKVLRLWQGALLVLLWVGAAAGAGLLFNQPIAKWATPALYVLAILVPVYFFVRVATGGLRPGSRQRTWGSLTTGIGLGIVPAMFAELLLALATFVVFIVYLSLHPDLFSIFQQLARELQDSADLDQVLKTAGPILTNPLTLLAALVFFSGFSPLIEETTKSLAPWAVFDRLASPAQGFAIGAISGAAFGLVESLLVSATPDASWTTTLLVRGASTMMHIMSAGLTGWGIGKFRTTRRVLPLLGMYLAAMGLHGLWNASVVAVTAGGIRVAISPGGSDIVGIVLILLGATGLLVLCIAIPLGMWAINWKFRTVEGGHGGAETQRGEKAAPEPAAEQSLRL